MSVYQTAEQALRERTAGVKDRQERRVIENEVTLTFQTALAEEYASDLPAVVQAEIWHQAWRDGHDAGYVQVERNYEDLACFAQMVAEAVTQ